MTILYSNNKADLEGKIISDFFHGWPKPPSTEVLIKSIESADFIVLAIDTDTQQLVGYITAISDNVLSAYIPFLEVIPAYQKQGIGHELVRRMLEQLEHLYMIDLVCDKELAGFYADAGLVSGHAMIKRNYANQAGVDLGT